MNRLASAIMVVPADGMEHCFCRYILRTEGFRYCATHNRFEADVSKLARPKDLGHILHLRRHDSDIVDGEVCAGAVEIE